jgi:hypothetical protein
VDFQFEMAKEFLENDIKFHKIDTNNVKKLGNGNWLELQEVEYVDPVAKVIRKWEVCKRKNCRNNTNVDGNCE